jgi:hypothetical protein
MSGRSAARRDAFSAHGSRASSRQSPRAKQVSHVAISPGARLRKIRLGQVTLELGTGVYVGPEGQTGRIGEALLELIRYLVRARGKPRTREAMVRDLRPAASPGAMGERVNALRRALGAAGEPAPERVVQFRDHGGARGYVLEWSAGDGMGPATLRKCPGPRASRVVAAVVPRSRDP